ncbi:membrane frizzled-related protein-like, partial [Antrostomus carolinensis]|uniref:membrane frizzled-related protein-like n=1 Tax=Antrostomus carolinensis TaxID=279965 RepID=UPI0010A97FC1
MKEFTEITLCPAALDHSKTEFCNPVFEGEEPRAVPSAEHLPDKDGTSPASPRDGLGQQLWGQAGWRYRADCKFTWLCVALMSVVLLFLIALLLGIVIHPCGGTLQGPEGSFSSPNSPGPYPPDALCIWHIEVGPGLPIQLKMETFNVEGTASCLFDRVELYEEQGASSMDPAPARGGLT